MKIPLNHTTAASLSATVFCLLAWEVLREVSSWLILLQHYGRLLITMPDNNDGITIFDITTPENPRYCFISGDDLGDAEHRVPISATEYVRSYYPVPSGGDSDEVEGEMPEEFILKNIAYFDGEPLVSLEMLADAWPQEYRKSYESSQRKEESDGLDASEESAITVIPSLAELALKPAVEHALRTDETTEVGELLWMPQKAELIKAILQNQCPFPDTGMALLTKIVGLEVEADKTIDLSHFLLSSEKIISMVAQFQVVEVLKLSHNPNVTIDTVRGILSSLPRLRRLLLLNTSVADQDLCNLLSDEPRLFVNLEALVHPLFLRFSEGTYPNAFSLMIVPVNAHSLGIASLAYFTPALIVQALTDYLAAFSSEDLAPFSALQSALVPQVILASDVRKDGQSWTERGIPSFPQFSLRAFKGEGWLFALQCPLFGFGSASQNKYAFVKINPAVLHNTTDVQEQSNSTSDEKTQITLQHKVCDLGTFLKEMELEGRPLPAALAVDALAAIFEKLIDTHGLALMNYDDVNSFIENAELRMRFRY
jgi:hypothetical protein